MLRPRFADGDEGRRFRQPVYLRHLPTELALHALDRGGGGRSAGGDHPYARRHFPSDVCRRVGQQDEDGRGGAEPTDVLFADQVEDGRRFGLGQADVGAANRRDDPDERPAVGMKHRQRPEVPVVDPKVKVDQRADGVHPRVAMSDHHALWFGGRAACVVQGDEICLRDLGAVELGSRPTQLRLVFEPSLAPIGLSEHDKMLHSAQLVPHAVDCLDVIRVHAKHGGARMRRDVDEVLGRQPEIDRHQHGADLGNGVKGFELLVRVGRDVGNPVALLDSHFLKRGGPLVAAVEELRVCEAEVAVNDSLSTPVQLSSAARKLERGQRSFHILSPRWSPVTDSASRRSRRP